MNASATSSGVSAPRTSNSSKSPRARSARANALINSTQSCGFSRANRLKGLSRRVEVSSNEEGTCDRGPVLTVRASRKGRRLVIIRHGDREAQLIDDGSAFVTRPRPKLRANPVFTQAGTRVWRVPAPRDRSRTKHPVEAGRWTEGQIRERDDQYFDRH
jgi:hypothetical protein